MNITSTPNDQAFFLKAITAEVARRVNEVAKEEADAAAKRVHERIRGEVDAIALRLLANYEVRTMTDRLVIEVKRTGQ
ncbi:hypothetical protein [Rhizobium sp. 18065]|uniref:hypothetical protein n=1 Tax=Rhizobium sp. 18065 TaxID=2681411 RepID=UPI0013584772|nr:hypothetical protein [Rhizobium sp. 18065]